MELQEALVIQYTTQVQCQLCSAGRSKFQQLNATDFQVTLNTGRVVNPEVASINDAQPNSEWHERSTVVVCLVNYTYLCGSHWIIQERRCVASTPVIRTALYCIALHIHPKGCRYDQSKDSDLEMFHFKRIGVFYHKQLK